ncbi:hypothetical protein AHAS_Ahas12G0140500 [Arachis hypogaea]
MTKMLSTLEFERFSVDGNHDLGFMLRSTWTIVDGEFLTVGFIIADSVTTASFQVRNNRRGTQPHSRSATFAAVWVVVDVEAAFDLRTQCCRFEMESHGEGSSDSSVQWTDGWSMDSMDNNEKTTAQSLEIEEGQSAAGDREDGSVAGDEGSMLVPTEIHVATDNPYGDEESGSVVLTAAALESAEYNSIEEAYKAYVAFAKVTGFAGKTELDPLVVVKYSYYAEKHLGNLFWSNGHMQYDYECFEDVLEFDSTYKKNLYNRPLVIFSGTNHHRLTIMFGFGLLEDENIPSYKWLLGYFLEVIQNKESKVVVTDGDEFMKETAVYDHFDVKDFKDYWAEVVRSFGLEDNDWIASTYEKKEQWVHAYLCDKFCAELEIEELPNRLVLKRWCKDAKSDRISTIEVQSDPKWVFCIRYGALWATCLSMCFLVAHGSETYEKVVNVVTKMSNELESMCYIGNKGGQAHPAGNHIDIGYLYIIRSKGAPRGNTNAKNGRRCRRNQFPGRGEARAMAGKGVAILSICCEPINVWLLEMKDNPLSCSPFD